MSDNRATRLLLWCLAGGALVQVLLWRWGEFERFTPIFRHLLRFYDAQGNLLLIGIAACAWLLRRKTLALAPIHFAADRPWTVAALLFPLLCWGSISVYHDHPLSMDEYTAVFQAQVFAAGRLAASFPPELFDRLIPPYFQGGFFAVAPAAGAASANYWPGFALLLAPFARMEIAWALNPAIGVLAIPALHRLTHEATGSREAAGWAVALTIASPVFILSSISYYAMQAHLLCNIFYSLLLLRSTLPRALLAGVVGSVALTLHQPVPHFLFALPFAVWLALRPGAARILAALIAGYLPLALLLGLGWYHHLAGMLLGAAPQVAGGAPFEALLVRVWNVISLPGPFIIEARLAGLSKVWTWASAGMLVLAAGGYAAGRRAPAVRVLAAALATTFFGYFLFRVEQGHGWGFRYVHSAWFVLPVLASVALIERAGDARMDHAELRGMSAWAVVLSLLFANAQRLVQVEGFIDWHLRQVPPLARTTELGRRELVFIDPASGAYLLDLVQNDPFLRSPRIVMLVSPSESAETLVQRRFPGYTRTARDKWGEIWSAPRDD
jgi:hypothetical protein